VSKDIKRMVAEIRGALDAYPREQLQEILAWVFKEYVVEGGAAPAQGALAMLDARTELEGLSFAELVTWLQLHLDVPELAALEVQGTRVSVRSGGRAIPIEVAQQPQPAPAAPAVASHPPLPPPQPMPPPAATPSTPASSPQPMPPPNPAPPSSQTPPNAPANQPASEEKKDDSASSRFSWLEVD
jgi:outer membrane biosynthesis protein TonB